VARHYITAKAHLVNLYAARWTETDALDCYFSPRQSSEELANPEITAAHSNSKDWQYYARSY